MSLPNSTAVYFNGDDWRISAVEADNPFLCIQPCTRGARVVMKRPEYT
jgi:hypothetical protein